MKHWLKTSLITLGCLIPVAFVVGFSTTWKSKLTITSVGSSGVKPFIEELSKDYLKEHKNIDITVDAGGSGFGISQVADGFTNIGNASKDPYESVNDLDNPSLITKWTNRHIKTYTVAWEGICLVYNPPKGVDKDDLDSLLYVGRDNINQLYQAFSGFKDDTLMPSAPTLGQFINPDFTSKYSSILNSTAMIPYVRTGGSLTSGTAASFYEYNRLVNKEDYTISDNAKKAFEVGNYGKNWKLIQTDEANSRAWDMFNKNNVIGSVVYLSTGFVEKNRKLIDNAGYGIFAYKKSSTITPYSIDQLSSNYDWCRPLNLMVSLDAPADAIDFIEDILTNTEKWEDKWHNLGASMLTNSQISSMKGEDGSFKYSDIDLNHDYYGANYDA